MAKVVVTEIVLPAGLGKSDARPLDVDVNRRAALQMPLPAASINAMAARANDQPVISLQRIKSRLHSAEQRPKNPRSLHESPSPPRATKGIANGKAAQLAR